MDQLLIALDVEARKAEKLAAMLRGPAGGFKIGSRLFTAEGPGIVRDLVARGDRVFLDLKYHDIPSTVAEAVAAATKLGVWMLDVHAAGGTPMMRRSAEAARAAAGAHAPPLVVAVTVLTSFSAEDLRQIGVSRPVGDQVSSLATMAQDAGLDGVVASPMEIEAIRDRCGAGFLIVTPGIRFSSTAGPRLGSTDQPAGEPARNVLHPTARDDQVRTMTAAEALAAGANYIVVGRPIVAASDPRAAAERLVEGCPA
jgi:orotidine-5'-phosphate decarboxylase